MRWPLALLPFVFAGAMAAADLAVDAPRVVTDSRVFHDVVAAANGGNAVVAWAHDNSAVKVARVRGDGTVLDVPARFVERGDKPEIACGGGRCIVAAIRDAAVVATLLDVDGAPLRSIVLGPPGSFVSISSDLTNDDSGLKTAASDDRFVVAWTSGYYESTAAVLTRDGDAIAHAPLAGRSVAASGYGGDVALATMENLTAGPLLLFRVGRDGRVTAGATVFDDLLLYAGRMALASSPTGSLLVVSGRQLFNGSYRGAVGAITLDTALQALAGPPLSTVPDLVASRVSAVCDGARYAVGFSEGSGLYDVLLLGDKKLQFQGVDEATLAMSGSDVFVASNSRRWTAVGYRVSAPEPIAVGFTVVEQHAPLLATDGRSALVGWSEDGRSCCIEWLGPSGIRHPIDVGGVPSYLRLPFDGHNYAAPWSGRAAGRASVPPGAPCGPAASSSPSTPARSARSSRRWRTAPAGSSASSGNGASSSMPSRTAATSSSPSWTSTATSSSSSASAAAPSSSGERSDNSSTSRGRSPRAATAFWSRGTAGTGRSPCSVSIAISFPWECRSSSRRSRDGPRLRGTAAHTSSAGRATATSPRRASARRAK